MTQEWINKKGEKSDVIRLLQGSMRLSTEVNLSIHEGDFESAKQYSDELEDALSNLSKEIRNLLGY